MTDIEKLFLYIPVVALLVTVSYNAHMFSKESKYREAVYRRKERKAIIKMLEKEDSVCAEWAAYKVKEYGDGCP